MVARQVHPRPGHRGREPGDKIQALVTQTQRRSVARQPFRFHLEAGRLEPTPNDVLQLTLEHESRLATPSRAPCSTEAELGC